MAAGKSTRTASRGTARAAAKDVAGRKGTSSSKKAGSAVSAKKAPATRKPAPKTSARKGAIAKAPTSRGPIGKAPAKRVTPVAKKQVTKGTAKGPVKKTAVKRAIKTTAKKPVAKTTVKATAKKRAGSLIPAKGVPPRGVSKVQPTQSSATLRSKAATKSPAPKKKVHPVSTKSIKFPKGIFSHATGTDTSEPFTGKELEHFREMILAIREEQQEQFEELTEQLRELNSAEANEENNAYSLHMAEQGTDAMEREKMFLQAQRVSDYIKKLEESIRRIDEGSFGLCRICGLRLDRLRLEAVPVTQVCTFYKKASKPCEPGRFFLEKTGRAELPEAVAGSENGVAKP